MHYPTNAALPITTLSARLWDTLPLADQLLVLNVLARSLDEGGTWNSAKINQLIRRIADGQNASQSIVRQSVE